MLRKKNSCIVFSNNATYPLGTLSWLNIVVGIAAKYMPIKVFKVVEATQEIPPTEDTQNVGIDENLISENIAPPIQREDVDRLMPFIEKWGGYSSESVSDATLLESVGIAGEYIPAWFKETSGWVVKGDTSPQEFIDAIRYLVEKGIIK